MEAYLILEQGRVFKGKGFGAAMETMGELVFHTAMTGTTELLTDPSTAGQALALTYPLIGNAGVCRDDFQSAKIWAEALIVSEVSDIYSNFRGEEPLNAVLERFSIPGIKGVDIRSLVRLLRETGALRCMVTRDEARVNALEDTLMLLRAYQPPEPLSYRRDTALHNPEGQKTVALPDTGARKDLIASLCARGLCVRLYKADTQAAEILADAPDGIVLAGGPGDPSRYSKTIETIQTLYEAKLPILALGLGHQLLALATGAQTLRLTRGHQGANYPVRELATGRVVITSQNHEFAVDKESIDPRLCEISHLCVNDGTVEGLMYKGRRIVSLLFHPDTCGTVEERQILDRFAAGLEARNA